MCHWLVDARPCAVCVLHYPCILTGKFTSVGHFTASLIGNGSYKVTALTSERVSIQFEFLYIFLPVFLWIFLPISAPKQEMGNAMVYQA